MLEIKNIRKTYGKFNLECSMKVEDGCITGLIGENGAGKSTTFKAIENLISLDSGEITIFGKPYDRLSVEERRQIGVVLSGSTFSETFHVKDIVKILKAFYPNFQKETFLSRCEEYQIPLNKPLKGFSTGMKAKLKVLIALSYQAKFLILDEPTAGLDVVARDSILNLLREYMEEDDTRSILISSHISGDLEGLCDDVYMIHKGKIIFHEDMDTLMSEYGLLKVTEEQYLHLDKEYLLQIKKEPYGYSCLTNQLFFYKENYPDITIEKGNLDEVIMMTIKGEKI